MPVSYNKIRQLLSDGWSLEDVKRKYHVTWDRLEAFRNENREETQDRLLNKIATKYSLDDLRIIAHGGIHARTDTNIRLSFNGDVVRFGVLGDTHFGSHWTKPERTLVAFNEFEKQECEFILHTGDVVEGWKTTRIGSVLEQSHIGFGPQKRHAAEILSQYPE